MFARRATTSLKRAFSTSAVQNNRVAILGAAGGIGQPLSLLAKLHPLVTSLSLYDIRLAPGVAADVAHCNTASTCVGYGPEDNGLEKALEGAEIVIIPAGMPRKPGMTRDDLFNANASIVRDLAQAVAKVAPKARIGVIANPVNSTVPIVAETFKKAGVYDPSRLFGVTTLDIVRASAFLSGIAGTKPSETNVPVVGGHSGPTIVPLLSQLPAGKKVVEEGGETLAALVKRIQYGGDEVVKAKDGAGSATLSMAYAGMEWADALLRAMNGEAGVKLCTYVESDLYKSAGVPYFSSPVELSSEGTVAKVHPIGDLHPSEQALLDECLPALAKNIEAGVKFTSA
ncbi:hypothetical protein JCM10207_003613 [Rhodosporidiobolus poonsookiae]